ncbi:inner membrane protein YbjM [Salmonella enterica subsp. enterica serovar Choleraesuis]|nr:inner membrane protein YbjM [Salmonella enterica subsp. enterica serovar Choleraesuis]
MMYRQRWLGIFCCFILFVLIFISQKLHIQRGHIESEPSTELGLLLFLVPGIVSTLFSRYCLIRPLIGALLAIPVCLLAVKLDATPVRPFWQELAWIFSAMFWCGIGSLSCMFVRSMLQRSHKRPGEHGGTF